MNIGQNSIEYNRDREIRDALDFRSWCALADKPKVACYYCQKMMDKDGIYHDRCYQIVFKQPNPVQ